MPKSVVSSGRKSDEGVGIEPKKLSEEDAPKKRRLSSWSLARFSRSDLRRKSVNVEIKERGSGPVEKRIYKPTCLKNTTSFLFSDIVQPKDAVAEESFIYEVRNFGLYILHVVLVICAIRAAYNLNANFHSMVLSDLIAETKFESRFILSETKFDNIHAPQEIWSFIKGVILKIIYPVETTGSESFLQDNMVVGTPQLRQVRVKADTCQTAQMFSGVFKSCFGYFHEAAEEKEPFGLKTTAWKYSFNEGKSALGQYEQYHGSGFAINFSRQFNYTLHQLQELEKNRWIRVGTRAVFLDFNMFCPNTNTFLVAKITFELLPCGYVIPSLRINTIEVMRFNDVQSVFFLAGHFVLLCFTVALTFALFSRLKRFGRGTLFTYSTIIDVAIVSLTYVTFCFYIVTTLDIYDKLDSLAGETDPGHVSFESLVVSCDRCHFLASFLLLVVVLKFFRYAVFFNDTFRMAVCSMHCVKGELAFFTCMNLFVLFALGIVYVTIYGTVNSMYLTPLGSMVHLFHHYARGYSINGAPSYSFAMKVMRAICLPAGVIYITCISQQTYVALIVYGWLLARNECASDPLRIHSNEFIWTQLVALLDKLNLYKWSNKLQEYYIVRMNEDDYFSFTNILRRYGYPRKEMRLLLRKYGIRKGDDLTTDELFEVYQEFWMRNTLHLEVSSHDRLKTDLEQLQRKVEYVEMTIADLKNRTESLADRFLRRHKVSPKPPSPETRVSPKRGFFGQTWSRLK